MFGALADPRNAGVLAVMRARGFASALGSYDQAWEGGGWQLGTNQSLLLGQRLTSRTGRFTLVLENTGNLVAYDLAKGTVIWKSNTGGKGVTHASMQGDGNFVLYTPTKAVWATNTAGKGGGESHLSMQSDGNLVIYKDAAGTQPIWNSGTFNQQAAQEESNAWVAAHVVAGMLPAGLDKLAYVGKTVGDLSPAAIDEMKLRVTRISLYQDPNTGEQKNENNFGPYWIAAPGPNTLWNVSKDGGTRKDWAAGFMRTFDNPATAIVQVKVQVEPQSTLSKVAGGVATAITAPLYVPVTAGIDATTNLVSQIPGVNIGTSFTKDAINWTLENPTETLVLTAAAAATVLTAGAAAGAIAIPAGAAEAAGAAATAVGTQVIQTGAKIGVNAAAGAAGLTPHGPPPGLTPQGQLQQQGAPGAQQADLLAPLKQQVLDAQGHVKWKSPLVIGGLVMGGILLYMIIVPPKHRPSMPMMVMPSMHGLPARRRRRRSRR